MKCSFTTSAAFSAGGGTISFPDGYRVNRLTLNRGRAIKCLKAYKNVSRRKTQSDPQASIHHRTFRRDLSWVPPISATCAPILVPLFRKGNGEPQADTALAGDACDPGTRRICRAKSAKSENSVWSADRDGYSDK